jgi:hypothetical protein
LIVPDSEFLALRKRERERERGREKERETEVKEDVMGVRGIS